MLLRSFSINRLIVLIITGGFLFLFVETVIEHEKVIATEIPAYIPIITSLAGLIIAFLTVKNWTNGLVRFLHFYLLLTIFVGMGGLFFHNKERFSGGGKEAIVGEKDTGDVKPPLLAPAAFIGLGVVGLLGTSRKRQAEIREK